MNDAASPSERIDQYIKQTGDWRGDMLARVRKAVLSADPGIEEGFKWMGSPVWERDGMILVGNAHKGKVKLTFSHGAKFPDPDGLFNGKDTGATRRSIDIFEGDELNERALTDLVRTAITYNRTHLKKNAPASVKTKVNTGKKA